MAKQSEERSRSASDLQSDGQSQIYVTQHPASFSGPTGLPSVEHIAPSGTSLRRGICVKYKQDCEYQPPVKAQKVQGLESRIADLSDYIQNGTSTIPPAFSSQPLGYDNPNAQQAMYPDSYAYQDVQGQSFQYVPYDPSQTDMSVPNSATFPPLPTDHDLNGYLPTPPQVAYPATFVSETTSQYPYPQYSEPGMTLVNPTGPSHPTHILPVAQEAQLNQVYKLGNETSPPVPPLGYPPISSDDSAPASYVFMADPKKPLQFVPSQTQSRVTSIPPPLQEPPSAPSDSSGPNVNTPSGSASTPGSHHAPPGSQAMYAEAANLRYTAEITEVDPVEGLTERLGEFLFSPADKPLPKQEEGDSMKKRRTSKKQGGQWTSGGRATGDVPKKGTLFHNRMERDGLKDEHRDLLLDCFLAHCRLFFEMSVPRFRYRMTFHDRRRPSLALLNAIYLWATRMSNSPDLAAMEAHFFAEACRHLDSAGPNSDRLIDAVRAAMLLCSYSYTNGRHHEGWLIAGLAVRLVMSTGLHQIPSLTFRPPPPESPFLRNRVHLLPPPEDSIELAERVHAFWCVYAIERCGALATGFPSSLGDTDISTPFGRPLDEIASQSVTIQDDVTIRDLYKGQAYAHPEGDSPYIRWVKAVTILERSSKLAFLTPVDGAEYTKSWAAYASSISQSSNGQRQNPPPEWLNQPKYRNPQDYEECSRALKHYVQSLGEDGISPVERHSAAKLEGSSEFTIKSHTILLHHQVYAIEMLMHDINSLDIENDVAVAAGRKSADLIRQLPPIPFNEVDAQVILVWCMITKVLIKELRRVTQLGDYMASRLIEDDVDVLIKEMGRIGITMHIARVQSNAMEELKNAAKVT
ncbi:hypothetical protein I316_07585 [Kwoniella heveanensis BCC8398]|uniref:Xylanolytic transcriptional activator regulatory domain-containing protein n=1 Tax=Kwoniella heveanensis BCC8398 TaxID=1296120 RepID=A0A1B9GID0_9TREE|nr:hypothetical protein I316_07585 [Kwoniella heveanensis BCC8398]